MRQIGTLKFLIMVLETILKVYYMEILVKDLVIASEYNLDYMFKLLRENGINNRIILNKDDLVKLKDGLEIVTHKSYMLRIYIDSILIDNNQKFVS